ncbi:hypothetical protein HDU97_008838 [Phlyctochytrium planicorne]|nr:hypothetical protein HDU97_008838 [Phlyctochytrium planicorne]
MEMNDSDQRITKPPPQNILGNLLGPQTAGSTKSTLEAKLLVVVPTEPADDTDKRFECEICDSEILLEATWICSSMAEGERM